MAAFLAARLRVVVVWLVVSRLSVGGVVGVASWLSCRRVGVVWPVVAAARRVVVWLVVVAACRVGAAGRVVSWLLVVACWLPCRGRLSWLPFGCSASCCGRLAGRVAAARRWRRGRRVVAFVPSCRGCLACRRRRARALVAALSSLCRFLPRSLLRQAQVLPLLPRQAPSSDLLARKLVPLSAWAVPRSVSVCARLASVLARPARVASRGLQFLVWEAASGGSASPRLLVGLASGLKLPLRSEA